MTDGLTAHAELTKGKHSLTRQQVLDILHLKRIKPEATQSEIAAFVGVSQSTVSRWLADYTDTTDEAANLLKASALHAAARTVELTNSEQDKVSLDASKAILTANKLLGNEDGKVMVGVQVVIGTPANLGHHNGPYQTQTEGEGLTGQQVTEAKVIRET